jgi:hypothetical protein
MGSLILDGKLTVTIDGTPKGAPASPAGIEARRHW